MLREEVAVDELDQAVQLLDGQQPHRDVEDEVGEHFAARKNEKRV